MTAIVLSRLENVRRTGSGWSARCPAHDDRHNSLSIGESPDGKILLHCFAGCPPDQVLAAIGLTWQNLNGRGQTYQRPPEKRESLTDPLTWLADYCGVPPDFLATLPLEAQNSALAFTFGPGVRKLREAGTKHIWWDTGGGPTPPLWPLPEAELPGVIWLVEGETDCLVSRYLGLEAYALTKGAKGALTLEQAQALKARGVHTARIVFDADDAGREGATKLAGVLSGAGIEAQVLDLAAGGVVDPLVGEKDLRDTWRRLRDRSELLGRLEAAALEVAKKPATNSKPHLQPYKGPVGGEVCAADLVARPHQAIKYLPFLGQPGYIPRGWSVLIAAYPKSGKTELVTKLCGDWTTQGEDILYVTEEPASIWQHRLANLPGAWAQMRLLFGLGMDSRDILARIETGAESVVVIDTVRNLLGLEDERDNSEVARVLGPYVAAARSGGKTLILLHHVRKGGGEHGEGITGAHAFLGIVDVALELLREPNLGDRKRRVRGWGRLMPIEELVYSLEEDGNMVVLGSPKAVQLEGVKQRVAGVLDSQWAKTREVYERLDEPRPSLEQVRLALAALVAEGSVERDPASDKPGATYRYRLKPYLQPASYMVGGKVSATSPLTEAIDVDATPATFSDNGRSGHEDRLTRPQARGRGTLPEAGTCLSCGGPLPLGRGFICWTCLPRGP